LSPGHRSGARPGQTKGAPLVVGVAHEDESDTGDW
jgi:hypothetical protein